jgi:hypothetical protein
VANPEHLDILQHGAEVWNGWRADNPEEKPDLSNANLRWKDLRNINLYKTDLTASNLHHANLIGAYLCYANLTGAYLSNADLRSAYLGWANLTQVDLATAHLLEANLRNVNLSGANLRGATLLSADLSRANLSGADLSEATVGWTLFTEIDLSAAKGLETLQHTGPSTIGIDTIYKSGGKIPDGFLRGAGVPDNFIAHLGSLVGRSIEFYSCFISYSTKDQEFAERLHNDLQAKGVRCWFAPEDLKIGERFRDRIDESIRLHDKLLIVLSKTSIASPWVRREVEAAFEREDRQKSKSTVLFPIRIDDAVMESNEAWAADIRRTRHIGDFSRWKDHDSYQKAFERLLRDLKAEARKP